MLHNRAGELEGVKACWDRFGCEFVSCFGMRCFVAVFGQK